MSVNLTHVSSSPAKLIIWLVIDSGIQLCLEKRMVIRTDIIAVFRNVGNLIANKKFENFRREGN